MKSFGFTGVVTTVPSLRRSTIQIPKHTEMKKGKRHTPKDMR